MSKILHLLADRMMTSPYISMIKAYAKSSKKLSFEKRALWGGLRKPFYAYGIFHGCQLAKKLGLPKVSVIEFGVAGGRGLLAMEKHAAAVEKLTGVSVEVYGFDTGEGLTPPKDYRDMPYRFATGNYKMDVDKLKERLSRAQLVLGDVKETVVDFLEKAQPAPIAFVSFDMDYYSSTMDAFAMFAADKPDRFFLPRIYMYFDNIIGNELSMYNDFVGELAAISEFNSQNTEVKIAENRVFRNYSMNYNWYHQIYIMHRFRHELYGKYISKSSAKTLSL